jgi:hypothetical protein
MKSGQILDSQSWDSRHTAQNGRLNFKDPPKPGACSPKSSDGSWLRVDFKILAIITKVLAQGRSDRRQRSPNFDK